MADVTGGLLMTVVRKINHIGSVKEGFVVSIMLVFAFTFIDDFQIGEKSSFSWAGRRKEIQ
jgi:hypothetical protein